MSKKNTTLTIDKWPGIYLNHYAPTTFPSLLMSAAAPRDPFEKAVDQVSNSDDWRRFSGKAYFCSQDGHSTAREYMLLVLRATANIQLDQHKLYYRAFTEFTKRNHGAKKRSEPVEPSKAKAYVMAHTNPLDPERGYWCHERIGLIVLWLLEFYLRPSEAMAHQLETVSQIPSAIVPCLYPQKDVHAREWAPIRLLVLQQYLKPDSLDRTGWWDKLKRLLPENSVGEMLVHFDANALSLYEDNTSASALRGRAAAAAISRNDINSVNMLGTAFLHLGFMLSHQSSQVLRQVEAIVMQASGPHGAPARSGHDTLLQKLFGVVVNMLNGTSLEVHHRLLVDLWTMDGGQFLKVLATTAEHVRTTLLLIPDAMATGQSLSNFSPCTAVIQSFNKITPVERLISIHYDWRHKLLTTGRCLPQDTRWVCCRSSECNFVEFLYQSEHKMQYPESNMLHRWLRSVPFQKVLGHEVQPERLLYAMHVVQARTGEESRQEAIQTLRHLDECNRRLRVLRFREARYHDVQSTVFYLSKVFPKQMRSNILTEETDDHGLMDSCFVGADCDGPYLVAPIAQLEIIRHLQLLSSLSQPLRKQRRNMPLLPVMCRLYMGQYPESFKSFSCEESALHVVVQTMAHWLQLDTEHSCLNKTKVPRFGDAVFEEAFSKLHLMCDQLQQAEPEGYPNIRHVNALADFLELSRGRTILSSVLERQLRMLERISTTHSRLGYEMPDLSLLPKEPWGDVVALPENEPDFIWQLLYEPIALNVVPYNYVKSLLLDRKVLLVVGRDPIESLDKLRESSLPANLSMAPAALEILRSKLSNYTKIFCAMQPSSQWDPPRTLKPRIESGEEPVDHFLNMLAHLEAWTSREQLAELELEELYPNFDHEALFSVGGDGVEGRTMLPIEMSDDSNEFFHFEDTFMVLCHTSTEFARHHPSGSKQALSQDDGYAPVARWNESVGVLMDQLMRFRDITDAGECANPLTARKSFSEFEARLMGWMISEPGTGRPCIDRQRLPHHFHTPLDMVQYCKSIIEERHPQQVDPSLAVAPPPLQPASPLQDHRNMGRLMKLLSTKPTKRVRFPSSGNKEILVSSWDGVHPEVYRKKPRVTAEHVGIVDETGSFLQLQSLVGGPTEMEKLQHELTQNSGK